MNGTSYFSAFPFVQSDALPGPGPASSGGETAEALPALSPSGAGAFGPGAPGDGPTPGVGYSWDLFTYSLSETEEAITRSGLPGTDASGWRGFANICPRNFISTRAGIAIRNTGGDWLRLGVFDASGNRLAVTPRFPPVANSIVVATFETPVTLEGSKGYYLAYWCDDTTGNLQFSVLSGRSTSNRDPLMQRNDPNENTLTLSASFAFTSLRPWLAVFE